MSDQIQKEKGAGKSPLGKGLASLLPPAATIPPKAASSVVPGDSASIRSPAIPQQGAEADPTPNKDRQMGISLVAIQDLHVNPFQPRKQFDDHSIEELAESIRQNGLIQPILVRRGSQGYQIIAGERRWRAAKLAGLKQVPIVIRRSTDKEALELAIIENIQREELNCVDTALAYQRLMAEFDLTQDQVAEKVGKDRASVANYVRLTRLPVRVQNWLKQGTLSFGHGKALLAVDGPDLQESWAERAVDGKWSVRQLEAAVAGVKKGDVSVSKESDINSVVEQRLKTIGRDLTQRMSAKVSIQGDGKKGRITIQYDNPDSFDRLLNWLSRS